MLDRRTLDELKEAADGKLAPEEIASLYREAFRTFGAQALWSRKPNDHPTIGQALVVADALRREGDMRARPLVERIEQACRAAL